MADWVFVTMLFPGGIFCACSHARRSWSSARGPFTVTVADACTDDTALVADAVAVFGYVPALAAVVALVTCTDTDAPGARLPNAHVNVRGAVPVMEHEPGPAYAGLIDQLTPLPPGNGSFSVTAVAVPVPAAAEFATRTVKPIAEPADTTAASAVLVIDSAGARTVVDADACTDETVLVADAVAVFE
jgi:hypothetical protein